MIHSMRLPVLSLLLCFSAFQSNFGQPASIERLFRTNKLSSASYCIYAMDARSGVPVYASEQKSLSTASVIKLFTTAVALDQLGANFTFSTSLWYTGKIDAEKRVLNGDLILRGGGDPAFYSSYFPEHYQNCFEDWILKIREKGIRQIKGNLLLDLSVMPEANLPDGWCWDDIGNYYGAGVSPLTFNDNSFEIHFSSAKVEGIAATIHSISPEISGWQPLNHVKSSLRSGDHTIVYAAPGSLTPRLEGTIPTNQADFVVKASLPDPAIAAGNALRKKITESGILMKGKVVKMNSTTNSSPIFLAEKLSPPLKDLIVPLNKESLNLFAEHLLCEIGRKHSGEPSLSKGIEAYLQFCKEKNIDDSGFFPNDGSGLSRSNALTAKTLTETLYRMAQSSDSSTFFASLPIAGVDGTLKNAFKGTPLEKNVVAKTGSMARVRSLSGKLTTRNHRTLLFTILINNFDLTSAEMARLLESILNLLYEEQPMNDHLE